MALADNTGALCAFLNLPAARAARRRSSRRPTSCAPSATGHATATARPHARGAPVHRRRDRRCATTTKRLVAKVTQTPGGALSGRPRPGRPTRPEGTRPNGRQPANLLGIVAPCRTQTARATGGASSTATSYVVLGMLSYSAGDELRPQAVGREHHRQLLGVRAFAALRRAGAAGGRRAGERDGRGGRPAPAHLLDPARRPRGAPRLARERRPTDQTEVRDLGLLKLFFAELRQPARTCCGWPTTGTSRTGPARTATTEQRAEIVDYADRWQVKTIELGIRYERCVEQFWADFIAELERGAAAVSCLHTGCQERKSSPCSSRPSPCWPCVALAIVRDAGGAPRRETNRTTRPVDFHQWRGHRDFAKATPRACAPAPAARCVIGRPAGTVEHTEPDLGTTRTYEYGRWTSPAYRQGFDATQLVASWNAARPRTPGSQSRCRARPTAGATTHLVHDGPLGAGRRRRHPHVGARPGGRESATSTSTRSSPNSGATLASYQLRVTLYREPARGRPRSSPWSAR